MLHDHCPHYDKAPMLHDRCPHYDKVPLLHDHCPHYDKELSCSIGVLSLCGQ